MFKWSIHTKHICTFKKEFIKGITYWLKIDLNAFASTWIENCSNIHKYSNSRLIRSMSRYKCCHRTMLMTRKSLPCIWHFKSMSRIKSFFSKKWSLFSQQLLKYRSRSWLVYWRMIICCSIGWRSKHCLRCVRFRNLTFVKEL